MKQLVNIDVRNGFQGQEQVKVVAAVLIDPATGQAVAPGGSASGASIDFELLIIVDANQVSGIRREMYKDGVTTVEYEDFMGGAWVPVQPVTLYSPALPANAATLAQQQLQAAALGAPADAVAGSDTATASIIALMKRVATVISSMSAKLPASLGGKTAAQSLSVTPATDANLAKESYTVTIMAVSTAAVGADFTAFGSQSCSSLDIVNNTGTDIEVRRGTSGATMVVRDGYSRLFQGLTNANGIQVRRFDQAATVVSLSAEAFS